MRVLLLPLVELMSFILQCCFWLFDVWKHQSSAEGILSRKKKMKMRCWMSSLWHGLYLNSSLCADYSILPFLNNNGKLFPLSITFIFGFEWARRQPVVQTSVSLKASIVSKIKTVIWFLTVFCEWYKMPLVNSSRSRSPEVNLFWKIYLYIIANYLFVCINDKKFLWIH